MSKYWVVGTTVQDQKMTDDFIKHGLWFGDKDSAQETIELIKEGDRMLLKRMLGSGAKEVQILAVGIVRKIGFKAADFRIIFVDWLDVRRRQTGPGPWLVRHNSWSLQ